MKYLEMSYGCTISTLTSGRIPILQTNLIGSQISFIIVQDVSLVKHVNKRQITKGFVKPNPRSNVNIVRPALHAKQWIKRAKSFHSIQR